MGAREHVKADPADPVPASPWRDGWSWVLAKSDVRLGPLAQLAAAAAIVLGGTLAAMLLYQLFDLTRLAIFFLGSVIVCALLFGRRPGVFAAFLAFGAYNFSLVEPRFTFRLAGADDILTLVVFLFIALTIGGLAGRVRDSERESRLRADETDALLEASRAFGDAVSAEAVALDLTTRLRAAAGADAFVLSSFEIRPEARGAMTAVESALAHGAVGLGPDGWRARLLSREPGSPVAAWRLSAVDEHGAARQERLCALMTDLASAAVNRIHLVDMRTGLEADAQAGRLRDAILSSISHDLRTPLATVLTSASSLQEYGDRFDLKTRDDLAGVIVHEADRLNRYVERLLDLSRIEAGQVAPRLEPLLLSELVDAALRRPSLASRAEAIRADDLDGVTPVLADARLLEQVVFNLLENALIHGGEGVQVDVRARREGDHVILEVEDDGVGVPEADLPRLCEKFQRGRTTDGPGTGIGLAVVKGFVEAMNGTLGLSRGHGGRRGLRVAITLWVEAAA